MEVTVTGPFLSLLSVHKDLKSEHIRLHAVCWFKDGFKTLDAFQLVLARLGRGVVVAAEQIKY